jgi:hypothetical protein
MPAGVSQIIGLLAIAGGVYAGWELALARPVGRRSFAGDAARAFVLVVLLIIGIDELVFGQNAILSVGYLLQLPLQSVQLAFGAALAVAAFVWSRE